MLTLALARPPDLLIKTKTLSQHCYWGRRKNCDRAGLGDVTKAQGVLPGAEGHSNTTFVISNEYGSSLYCVHLSLLPLLRGLLGKGLLTLVWVFNTTQQPPPSPPQSRLMQRPFWSKFPRKSLSSCLLCKISEVLDESSFFCGNKNCFENRVNVGNGAMSTNVSEFGLPSATSILILGIARQYLGPTQTYFLAPTRVMKSS